MGFHDPRHLRETANRRIQAAAYDPRKLMLVYTGATAVLMLLAVGLNFFLQGQISGTGGLGGIGTRAVLETAAQVLQLAVNFLLPFWNMGYLWCVLRMVRGERFGLDGLLEGFRHFGPVLRLSLLYSGYFFLIGFLCFYPSMLLAMLTPLSAPMREVMEPLMESSLHGTTITLDDAAMGAVTEAMMPILAVYAVVFLAVAAPKFYRFRLAYYALLDDPKAGARAALRRSGALMKGSRMALFKLDVRFWWFYLLEGLVQALCYGDLIASSMGIQLPLPENSAYFLCYVMYLAAQMGLYLWARNHVECTYAAGYDELCREVQSQ